MDDVDAAKSAGAEGVNGLKVVQRLGIVGLSGIPKDSLPFICLGRGRDLQDELGWFLGREGDDGTHVSPRWTSQRQQSWQPGKRAFHQAHSAAMVAAVGNGGGLSIGPLGHAHPDLS